MALLLGPGRGLSVSPDGTRAATVLPDSRGLQIWNLLSGEREIVLTNSSGSISYASFQRTENAWLPPDKARKLELWNTTDWSSEPLGESTYQTNGAQPGIFARWLAPGAVQI